MVPARWVAGRPSRGNAKRAGLATDDRRASGTGVEHVTRELAARGRFVAALRGRVKLGEPFGIRRSAIGRTRRATEDVRTAADRDTAAVDDRGRAEPGRPAVGDHDSAGHSRSPIDSGCTTVNAVLPAAADHPVHQEAVATADTRAAAQRGCSKPSVAGDRSHATRSAAGGDSVDSAARTRDSAGVRRGDARAAFAACLAPDA